MAAVGLSPQIFVSSWGGWGMGVMLPLAFLIMAPLTFMQEASGAENIGCVG